jgi:hypothetical protein
MKHFMYSSSIEFSKVEDATMSAELFESFKYRKSENAWIAPVSLSVFAALKSKRGRAATGKSKTPPHAFTITVPARNGDEPSESQAKAFRHLIDHEATVYKKVAAEIFASCRDYGYPTNGSVDGLLSSNRVILKGIEITREHHKKSSYLAFDLDTDWEVEHGMFIVYSPATKKADWGAYDSLCDLTESDEDVGDLEDESPWQQLVDAIYFGDKKKIKQLVEAGVDINDVPKGETPPLIEAVESVSAEHIKMFLKYGADPNAYHKESRSTAYKMALKTRNEYGFAGSTGRQPAFMRDMMDLAKQSGGGALGKLERDWLEAIRLMEEAGAKK